MKILMINVVCGIRSTGRICTDLATALEAEGHEVKIAYGREIVPEKYRRFAVRIGSDFDSKMHGIKARLFDASGFGSKKATIKFIQWVREYNPDVIHIHNLHGYYINIEVLFNYLRTCGKKIIWTLHDCWAFTGHSPYCDAVGCEKWIGGCSDCPNSVKYPKSFIDRSKSNWQNKKTLMADIPDLTIITPSEWLAGFVRKSFLSQYQVKVIYNGIDTSLFFPVVDTDFRKNYGIDNKYLVLGVSTSWDDLKGYSDYLKLADILGDEYLVVLVGLTKKQIKTLPSNILGIERTNSLRELVEIYSSSDVYVNLSYCESFGMTNVEAQLCGTPVISYNSGGCVESGQTGQVVNRGDLEAVASAVIRLRTESDKKISPSVDRAKFEKRKMEKAYVGVMTSR